MKCLSNLLKLNSFVPIQFWWILINLQNFYSQDEGAQCFLNAMIVKVFPCISRFHAYAVVMEMDAYEGQPLDPKTNKANIVLKKKTFGGVPPGAGMREDVMLIFEELEEARNVRSQIQALTEQVPEPKIQIGKNSLNIGVFHGLSY